MKILIASDISKYYMSGVASVVTLVAESLTKLGHEVKVLTLSNTVHSNKEENEYYISSFHVPLYPELRYTFVRRDECIRELIGWKPDIIHIQTEGAISEMGRHISKKTGAPIVMTMHSDYEQFLFGKHSNAWYSHLFVKIFLKNAYRGVETLITPSEKAKRMLLRLLPKKDVRVVSNGIKIELFRKTQTEEEKETILASLGLSKDDTILVTVSRLSKEKKIEELIRFFPELLKHKPDLKLLIVGFGPDKKNLENLAEEEGIGAVTKFAGRIDHDQLYRYYKLGKVFVCASDYETQGLTYIESLACGVPSVCRDDPALIGIVEEGYNGFLYHTKEEFVEKVLRLLDDSELYEKTVENALVSSENFDDLKTSELLVNLYQELINRKLKNQKKE